MRVETLTGPILMTVERDHAKFRDGALRASARLQGSEHQRMAQYSASLWTNSCVGRACRSDAL